MKFNQRTALLTASAVALLTTGMLVGQAAPGNHIKLFREILTFVNEFEATAENPSAVGIAAVLGVKEHMDSPTAHISYLETTLPKVSDVVVKRAIRIQLADLYKKAGQRDKAMEQLDALVLNQP